MILRFVVASRTEPCSLTGSIIVPSICCLIEPQQPWRIGFAPAPFVKWISRDRSGEYALGASEGAPRAQQVMDRWHVIKNWREALERVVSRISPRLELRLEQTRSTPFPKRKKARTTHEQAASEASRQRRLARYEEVLECYHQGLPIAQIAKQLHLARGTIYTYLAADSFPERSPRSPSPSTGKLIAPYTTYLRQRCEEGCQNAQQLYREIQVQGFTGNPRTVLRWLQAQGLFPRRYELRTFQDDWKQAEAKESHTLSGGEERRSAPVATQQEGLISSVELEGPLASARQLSYLFVNNPARLEAKDQQLLAFLQQEQEIELAYRMTQQLFHLIKKSKELLPPHGSASAPPVGSRNWKRLPSAYKKSCPLFKRLVLFPTTMV
jgi:transposase